MLGISYPPNLATLSKEDQDAIEREKQLWYKTWKAIHTMKPEQIKKELQLMDCDIAREDMRYRLNEVFKNKYKKTGKPT